MKSYTDLEQSKKLAEILPLESADMEYLAIKEIGKLVGDVPFVKDDSEVEDSAYSHIYDRIACWSLAALLSVVPEEVSLNSFKDGNWNAMVQQNGKMIYGDANNSVDACVAMIIKLNEQNLL